MDARHKAGHDNYRVVLAGLMPLSAVPKRLFIKTYGCQMNEYDSGRMAELLAGEGYAPVADPAEADLVLLNTCHIREKAAEKVYSELGRLRVLKEAKAAAGGGMVLAVAGCVAQAEGEEMRRRAPFVDLVVGPQSYHRLPAMLLGLGKGGEAVATDFTPDSKFDELPEERQPQGVSAFLTVQEGCDKFCSFCVVPYTRGMESSRPVSAIVAEAKRLLASGARELVLLGQNVNGYRFVTEMGAETGLGALIRALADLPGLFRLRYTTSHPRDMDDDLVSAHAEVASLMPFLHLPAQSGSDRILQAMNRRYIISEYLGIVERLRRARSDLVLSSDFIVGYPGETRADFEATLSLVKEVGYASAYSFKFSPRPGTRAAEAEDQVPEAVKEERLAELQSLLATQQAAFDRDTVGKTVPVLFERLGRYSGQFIGRTPHNQAIFVSSPEDLTGALRPVRVTGLSARSLAGELVEPRA